MSGGRPGEPARVTLIPGDGSGPELVAAAVRVLEAAGARLAWDRQEAGEATWKREGTPLPERVLDSLRANRVGLKGPITTPVGTGFRSVNVALRRELDLYACVRPLRTYPGVPTRFPELDLVVVRENTEDLYAGIEFAAGSPGAARLAERVEREEAGHLPPGSAVALKAISPAGSERIARFAFEYARAHARRKITVVHKANILKHTDGLFLETARRVAGEYAEIALDDRIIDHLSMQLVQAPRQFDVLLLPNLYGDIVSDLGAGLVGGLGVAPGANFGVGAALFEPVHGSAPAFAGQNRLNPTAVLLSGVWMLRHLGQGAVADRVETALARVLAAGEAVTFDLKPAPDDPTAASTTEMAEAVIAALPPAGDAPAPTTAPDAESARR